MSRARSITHGNGKTWFDMNMRSMPAKVEHLELLAAVEDLDPDDLLEEGLTQGEIILRLRKGLDQGVIPPEILERQRERREYASKQRECRLCTMDGIPCGNRPTRHHYIPRWIMLELDNYESYASRSLCTIPACWARHRDLHMRQSGAKDKSIVGYLNREERLFAHRMLNDLEEQHPKIIGLIRSGWPEVSYEAQLIRDYDEGNFSREESTCQTRRQSESVSA